MPKLAKVMNGVGTGLSVLTYGTRWYAAGHILSLAWSYRYMVDICLGLAALGSMLMITLRGLQISRQIMLHPSHPNMSEAESVMLRRQLEAEGYIDRLSPIIFYVVFTVVSFYLADYTKMILLGIVLFFAQTLGLVVAFWRRHDENVRYPVPKS